MWVGEQITERGIGNGISLIIMAGIVTDIPSTIANYLAPEQGATSSRSTSAPSPGSSSSRSRPSSSSSGASARSPSSIHGATWGDASTAGRRRTCRSRSTRPAPSRRSSRSSLLMFPATLANLHVPGMQYLESDHPARRLGVQHLATSLLIVFFCYFYTAVTFQAGRRRRQPEEAAGEHPRHPPGKQTAEYIDRVLTRITFGGAMYVAAVCVVPEHHQPGLPRPVPLRRHLDHDRRRRRARHGEPDRSPPHHPPLRRHSPVPAERGSEGAVISDPPTESRLPADRSSSRRFGHSTIDDQARSPFRRRDGGDAPRSFDLPPAARDLQRRFRHDRRGPPRLRP